MTAARRLLVGVAVLVALAGVAASPTDASFSERRIVHVTVTVVRAGH